MELIVQIFMYVIVISVGIYLGGRAADIVCHYKGGKGGDYSTYAVWYVKRLAVDKDGHGDSLLIQCLKNKKGERIAYVVVANQDGSAKTEVPIYWVDAQEDLQQIFP